ncbi:unnamed protein product [Parnassius mnemosyne]|uniref:Reverse transcriptase/retrotransposon-derived protein RNase H-like domain-containing protein n=1 Tax=Parnassius mnemosyne TaxID=213953 RepID=A0AAV1KQT8_9NEOP
MPFEWGVEQDKARQYIIDCLTNEPVLGIYDPRLPTEVHTDASATGYGAVLIQIHEGGLRRAVAYFSKSTQGAKPKYHSYELETIAVVKALQNFRKYLLGVSFKIVTDCNTLKLTERKKDFLPRVVRWWLSMQDPNQRPKTQLILNSTKHSTTNMSPLQLLIGSDSSTPVIRALVLDVAIDIATPNREELMAL